jgi:hypothetical protein
LVPRGAQWTALIVPLTGLRALMRATGWPTLLVELRDQRIVAAIGDAPWLGTGYAAGLY